MIGQIFSIQQIRASALQAYREHRGLKANPFPKDHFAQDPDAHAIWESAYVAARDAARTRALANYLAA